MFRKLFIGFAIAASLSACGANATQDSPQSSSPQPTQTASNSPSLSASTSPSSNPSSNIEAGSPTPQAPQASPTPIPQTTPENSQAASEQTAQAKIWLIPSPVILYKKLGLLNKKLVKGEFETTEDFNQRSEKERKDLEKKLGVSFNDIFLIKTPLDSQANKYGGYGQNYKYDADKRVLSISYIAPGSTILTTHITDSTPEFKGTEVGLSFGIFPENTQNSEVEEYWLNKNDKFDTDGILISNVQPPYAKDLIEQNRIFFEYFFTTPSIQPHGKMITGKLVNLKLVDGKTGNVLWSLN